MIFSAAAFTVLFASCQKQDNTPVTSTENQLAHKTTRAGSTYLENYKGGKMRKYDDDNGGPNYGCPTTGGNCHPEDIVITAPHISDMVLSIDRMANMGTFVQTNREVLSQTIPVQYLDGVVNGSLHLSMRGDVGVAYRVILFKDAANAVAFAVPVVK